MIIRLIRDLRTYCTRIGEMSRLTKGSSLNLFISEYIAIASFLIIQHTCISMKTLKFYSYRFIRCIRVVLLNFRLIWFWSCLNYNIPYFSDYKSRLFHWKLRMRLILQKQCTYINWIVIFHKIRHFHECELYFDACYNPENTVFKELHIASHILSVCT